MNVLFFFLSITINKNAVPGDLSALAPGGVRLGTAALTSRNFKESDFRKVADFLDMAVQIALRIQVGFFVSTMSQMVSISEGGHSNHCFPFFAFRPNLEKKFMIF